MSECQCIYGSKLKIANLLRILVCYLNLSAVKFCQIPIWRLTKLFRNKYRVLWKEKRNVQNTTDPGVSINNPCNVCIYNDCFLINSLSKGSMHYVIKWSHKTQVIRHNIPASWDCSVASSACGFSSTSGAFWSGASAGCSPSVVCSGPASSGAFSGCVSTTMTHDVF